MIAQTAIAGVAAVLSSTQHNSVDALLYSGQITQFWQLQDAGQGAYAIVNQANDLLLACDAQNNVSATSRTQQIPDSQAWFFDLLDNGLYIIRNKATQRAL